MVFIKKNNLTKITDGAHALNLRQYGSVETQRIVVYVNNENVTYFYSFGVEHIPK